VPALAPSTPLARLQGTAIRLGVVVLDAADGEGPGWMTTAPRSSPAARSSP
jgi:hypothetical protein